MKNVSFGKFAIMSVFAIAMSNAYAAPNSDAPIADCDGIKIATGPKGKGYSTLFADIKKVCGAKVNICEVTSEGGLENLALLSTKEADVGFVQLDTFMDTKNSDENIAALQKLFALNNNYMHIIANANGLTTKTDKRIAGVKVGTDVQTVQINNLTDLRGKSVALVGTAKLMGRQINKLLGLNMNMIDVKDDATAFEKVKSGEVAAMFTVSGWQGNKGAIGGLQQSSGLILIPFNASINEPYKVKPLNYKNMVAYNVNSLAIQNMMVSRQFSGQRQQNIIALQNCIASNMNELKEGNYSPAWNEVKDVEISGIQSFKKK